MDLAPFIPIIVLTSFLFLLLAFLLLAPVSLFLDREEKASQHWTEEALARRLRAGTGPDSTTTDSEPLA